MYPMGLTVIQIIYFDKAQSNVLKVEENENRLSLSEPDTGMQE